MLQTMMATLEIDKEVEISTTVANWMSEKIIGSKIAEISIKNTELIFCGTLNTFLAEVVILSTEVVSIDELKHLLNPYPHFIHRLTFKNRS